jgi:hypothetical protein
MTAVAACHAPPGQARTAFVGAGGGGDTAAALLRSTLSRSNAVVYGAGYSAAEYASGLARGVAGKGPASSNAFDRLPHAGSPALVDAYLRSLGVRCDDGVFELTPDATHVDALFGPLRPDASLPVSAQPAGFKYATLLDEAAALRALRPAAPLRMFRSVRDFASPRAVQHAHAALRDDFARQGVTVAVLVDFGADVFDFGGVERRPLQRDKCVLLSLLHLLRTGALSELRIEAYGPGVDAHAPLDVVARQLEAVAPFATVLTPQAANPAVEAYVAALRAHAAALGPLFAPGRATRNFVEAYTSLREAGDVSAFVTGFLEQRHDFRSMAAERQAVFRADTARALAASPGAFRRFCEVHVVVLTPANAAAFVARVCKPEYDALDGLLVDA